MAKNLITSDEIKAIAFPRKNIDESLLKDSFIEKAELKHIKFVLGKDFYDQLRSQNDSENLTPDNKTFLNDFLKNSLAFYVAMEVSCALRRYTPLANVGGLAILQIALPDIDGGPFAANHFSEDVVAILIGVGSPADVVNVVLVGLSGRSRPVAGLGLSHDMAPSLGREPP